MSKYNGLLLFDIAEEPINGWTENLGTRGMYQKWEKGEDELFIHPYEDSEEDEWEVWVDVGTDCITLGYGSFLECKDIAIAYMKVH